MLTILQFCKKILGVIFFLATINALFSSSLVEKSINHNVLIIVETIQVYTFSVCMLI